MKKKSIILIVSLMGIALLGVLFMQLYFLSASYNRAAQAFDQNVNSALSSVVEKLQKRDAMNFFDVKAEVKRPTPARNKASRKHVEPTQPAQKPEAETYTERIRNKIEEKKLEDARYARLLKDEQRKADSIFNLRDSMLRMKYPGALPYSMAAADMDDKNFKVQIDVYEYKDMYGNVHQQTVATPVPKAAKISSSGEPVDSVKQYIIFDANTGPMLRTIAKPRIVNLPNYRAEHPPVPQKSSHITKVRQLIDSADKNGVIQDIVNEYRQVYIPLSQRLNHFDLDTMLRNELQSRGIFTVYQYKVTSAKRDSLIFRSTSNKISFPDYNTYSTEIFKKDMIRDAGMLTITIPQKSNLILSNMGYIMLSSSGLLLVLIFCFGFTLYTILRQKKISEMKTDFINNMTHEFKTPVSTIMIASEALKDAEVAQNTERINRLANIIYDENVRLGNHIERVLNVARIDKDELKLERKKVEVNDLVAAVADSMGLQLQKKEATINLELNATRSTVIGDELHLSNVLFNLIDNAIKYSPKNPDIRITTSSSAKNLHIRVSDKGIGMSRDQLTRIFDQFYRIPTGNLHDVKGFGLGLSYVNNIVKRMEGSVKVRSEKDRGSEFEVILPLS